jgi:hypothetical protein
LSPDEYVPDDLTHVDAVTDDEYCAFYIQFSDKNIPAAALPRTFKSLPVIDSPSVQRAP